MKPTHPKFVIAVVLAVAGFALSCYLSWQHAEFQRSGRVGGLCSLVEKFDCSAVENSSFSSLMGIPTASFGVFYFAVLLAFLLGFRPALRDEAAGPDVQSGGLARPDAPPVSPDDPAPAGTADVPTSGEIPPVAVEQPADAPPVATSPSEATRFWRSVAALNAVGVGSSIALALITILYIGAFCFGCVLVYATNLLLLIALIAWRRPWLHPMEALRGVACIAPYALDRFRESDPLLRNRTRAAVAVIAVLLPVNFYAVPKYVDTMHYRSVILGYENNPVSAIRVQPWNLAKGTPGAPIQIVKFTDFQCPKCRDWNEEFERMLTRLGEGRWQLVYKMFPLDRDCNRLLREMGPDVNMHPGSCLIALLAQGAGAFDAFWRADNLFYGMLDYAEEKDGKTVMTNEGIQRWVDRIAAATGIGATEWRNFSLSDANKQRLAADIEEGIALGLTGTPAIFINGRRAPTIKERDIEDILEHIQAGDAAP